MGVKTACTVPTGRFQVGRAGAWGLGESHFANSPARWGWRGTGITLPASRPGVAAARSGRVVPGVVWVRPMALLLLPPWVAGGPTRTGVLGLPDPGALVPVVRLALVGGGGVRPLAGLPGLPPLLDELPPLWAARGPYLLLEVLVPRLVHGLPQAWLLAVLQGGLPLVVLQGVT
jgi:hypothetical protein